MDVKTLCLGVLTLGDASGYEIRKQFEHGPLSYFHQAGFGSIYPALGQLKNAGWVKCVEHEQQGRPDKKVYSITPAGLKAFRKSLGKNPTADKIRSETTFMFFFAAFMDGSHLEKVFDGYLAQYKEKIAHIESLDAKGVDRGRLFARGMGETFYRAIATYMEANRDYLLADAGKTNDALPVLPKIMKPKP